MKDIDTIVITIDEKEYAVIKKVKNYVFLSNINNPKDIRIRKVVTINNEQYLDPLTEEEFTEAISLN